jgi:hypothetical protein
LGLEGEAGRAYRIETSFNLRDWAEWTNVIGPVWRLPLEHPFRSERKYRFYRAVIMP